MAALLNKQIGFVSVPAEQEHTRAVGSRLSPPLIRSTWCAETTPHSLSIASFSWATLRRKKEIVLIIGGGAKKKEKRIQRFRIFKVFKFVRPTSIRFDSPCYKIRSGAIHLIREIKSDERNIKIFTQLSKFEDSDVTNFQSDSSTRQEIQIPPRQWLEWISVFNNF